MSPITTSKSIAVLLTIEAEFYHEYARDWHKIFLSKLGIIVFQYQIAIGKVEQVLYQPRNDSHSSMF